VEVAAADVEVAAAGRTAVKADLRNAERAIDCVNVGRPTYAALGENCRVGVPA
jgi:hypothetical protein